MEKSVQSKGIDPDLVGLKAFNHPAVHKWWEWVIEEYRPRYPVALITPCSSRKPYTRSPTSRKIRGLLRRLNLWDGDRNRPRGLEWLYFSDLLVLVPYERAEDYPACCYDVPPRIVLRDEKTVSRIAELLCRAMQSHGYREIITFLPRMHRRLFETSKTLCRTWPREVEVQYTILSLKNLENVLRERLGV